MKSRNLIVDTDGGVDDAQALVMLIGNGIIPQAVTTVFGNVSLDSATGNIAAVLATLGAKIPVFKGAHCGLVQPLIDAVSVHGEDGLGGARRPEYIDEAEEEHAVDYLRRVLSAAAKSGDTIDLMMIGPLTNLALALRLEPEAAKGVGRLYIMGGTLNGRGNVTPAAEFNIFADPEAAGIVFSSELDIVLVPWEVCFTTAISGGAVDTLFDGVQDSAPKQFSKALADHLRQNAMARGRGDQMLFVDPLAAVMAIDDSIATRIVKAAIEVEVASGAARGMTIVDPSARYREANISVVEAVDLARVQALYKQSITYIPNPISA